MYTNGGMTIAGFTFTKVGFKSRMRGQCFGVSPLVSREKSFMEIRNVMALIDLIGQKSRSE